MAREYRIATVAWIGWSPLHVALEKGFWEELNLQVDVAIYDDPIVILEAIKAKKIDLAMDMAGSLVGVYMKGEPVVAIAETNWSHGGDKIIVRQGDRLENHRGGVIGVFLDQPSCLYFLGQYLSEVDLQLSDFRIVEINPRDLSAQFIAGRLPAIVNYEPWTDDALNKGNGRVLATSADYQGCIPECLWGYRQTIEGMPEEDIHNLLRGWIKAVRWIKDLGNRREYFKILREKTFEAEPGLAEEDFSSMMQDVAIHDPDILLERNKDSGGLVDYLNELKRFLQKNSRLTTGFEPRDVFENRFIMHVLKHDAAQ
ncbi:MAG: ABC transporter substrate-binding protein [Desulfobacterales bacterium]|nr:ABC transporter substrate-binding protein [Desulfobacterales bacterium]